MTIEHPPNTEEQEEDISRQIQWDFEETRNTPEYRRLQKRIETAEKNRHRDSATTK